MINYLSRIFFMLFLVGCKSVEIGAVGKRIMYPGQPGIKVGVSYSAVIQVKDNLVVKEVKSKDNNEKLGFYFVELPNGLLIKGDQELSKGEYSIQIQAEVENQIYVNDTLVFVVTNKNKKDFIIEKKIETSQEVRMK